MKKIACLLGCIMMCLTLFSCAASDEYVYKKTSDRMLKFESSDNELDNFLNDFLHRHLRYDEYSIGVGWDQLGTNLMYDKEWEAKSVYFFDTTDNALPSDRQKVIENYLYNLPIDKFGYTWMNFNDLLPPLSEPQTYTSQGWPFPDYSGSNGLSMGWEFNRQNETEGWSAEIDGNAATSLRANAGLLELEFDDASSIKFISPTMTINTFHGPFLNVEVRSLDDGSFGKTSNFEDLYIHWKTSDSADWYTVSYSEFATIPGKISAAFGEHIFFPMYLHPQWGTDKTVTNLAVELRSKEGKTVSGDASLNFVRADYDTRQPFDAMWLIAAAAEAYKYTGDVKVLSDNLNRYRQAFLFLLGALQGSSGLLDNSYLIGHDGYPNSPAYIGQSLGQSWYDILSYPVVDMYENVYFYKTIKNMIYLESMAEANNLDIPKPSVVAPSGHGTIEYSETVESLTVLAQITKNKLQQPLDKSAKTGFFDTEKGRFVAGFDALGNVVDYGFVAFNLELLNEGIATDEQAQQVLSWINGDRIVEADIGIMEQTYAVGKKGSAVLEDGSLDSTGTFGIYDYEFAPRITTVKNREHYVWTWPGTNPFGSQIQDGGAAMYVSYYDIMSRMKYRGAEDAFGRLKEINAWYKKVEKVAKEMGVDTDIESNQFYRIYYSELGIPMQGGGVAGGIGLDNEFLEAAMLYVAVPDAFFGLGSEKFNTLKVCPNLPESLSYWKMENLLYHDVAYDLTIGKDFVQIDCVRGNSEGLTVDVMLKMPQESFKVYVDGVETSNYKVESGRVVVNVPLKGCKISIR